MKANDCNEFLVNDKVPALIGAFYLYLTSIIDDSFFGEYRKFFSTLTEIFAATKDGKSQDLAETIEKFIGFETFKEFTINQGEDGLNLGEVTSLIYKTLIHKMKIAPKNISEFNLQEYFQKNLQEKNSESAEDDKILNYSLVKYFKKKSA